MKNKKKQKNYLEFIPRIAEGLVFKIEDDGLVTLEIENKGVFNRIFQIILKKPKISYIHLDEFGSFIWKLIDGKLNILEISEKVKEAYGDKAEPLYNRIVKYFEILKSYKFITF